jgi:hypothetical protein
VANVTDDLRERLEEVRDALLADDRDGARGLLPKVEESYRRYRRTVDTPR